MDRTTKHTLDLMLGEALTTSPCDNKRAVLALRAFPDSVDRQEALQVILAKRAAWRVWRTVNQRKWQACTRNPNKANHHDSIAIREFAVRGR